MSVNLNPLDAITEEPMSGTENGMQPEKKKKAKRKSRKSNEPKGVPKDSVHLTILIS